MDLIKIIENTIFEYLNENQFNNEFKLYHRLHNKSDADLTTFIKSVINKGLIRHDNGEIGNVIWFSKEYDDYGKNGKFVVSIDYNKINKEKYNIVIDSRNGYAYKDIPFKELNIIKIPTIIILNRQIISSDDVIKWINNNTITLDKLNNLDNTIIYGDIFNKYVQPYINIENFISKLDRNKIKIIDVF